MTSTAPPGEGGEAPGEGRDDTAPPSAPGEGREAPGEGRDDTAPPSAPSAPGEGGEGGEGGEAPCLAHLVDDPPELPDDQLAQLVIRLTGAAAAARGDAPTEVATRRPPAGP